MTHYEDSLQCDVMTISIRIGQRIRTVRVRLGYTQDQFGKKLNISGGAVSSYELGDSLPSIRSLILIARLGLVSLDWLLTGATMDSKAPEDQELTEEEVRLLVAYRNIAKTRRKIAIELIESLSRSKDRKRHTQKKEEL